MAAQILPVLRSLDFHTSFAEQIPAIDRLLAEAHLTTCYWSDEHLSDCRSLATVHHLESDLEFCPRHFAMVEKGEVIL